MKYPWIDSYLLGKRGVVKDLQADWNWVRYKLGDKMFAAICLDREDKPYYINLKLEVAEGEFLRSQYKDIVPGYYSNKQHWNSVNPNGEVPDDLLKDLLDKSYKLVLAGFPKKRQREILRLSCCGAECEKCGFYGGQCKGCDRLSGKPFYMPEGQVCAIYACAVRKKKFANCAGCGQMPCEIWKAARDPAMTQEEFEKDMELRRQRLRL